MSNEFNIFRVKITPKVFYLRFSELIFGILQSKYGYPNVKRYATKQVLSNLLDYAIKIDKKIGITRPPQDDTGQQQENITNTKGNPICNNIKVIGIKGDIHVIQGVFVKNRKAVIIEQEISVIKGAYKVVGMKVI